MLWKEGCALLNSNLWNPASRCCFCYSSPGIQPSLDWENKWSTSARTHQWLVLLLSPTSSLVPTNSWFLSDIIWTTSPLMERFILLPLQGTKFVECYSTAFRRECLCHLQQDTSLFCIHSLLSCMKLSPERKQFICIVFPNA